jgi:hypothetical protein
MTSQKSPCSKAAPTPPRIAERPSPHDWSDDELLTLPEAAALFWPAGPLSTRSLRTAKRHGQLAVVMIAGKMLTNKRALAEMGHCRLRQPDELAYEPVSLSAKPKLSAAEARNQLEASIAGKLANSGKREY